MTFIPNVSLNDIENLLNRTFTDKIFLVDSDRYGLNITCQNKSGVLSSEEQELFNDSVLDLLFQRFGELIYSYVYLSYH